MGYSGGPRLETVVLQHRASHQRHNSVERAVPCGMPKVQLPVCKGWGVRWGVRGTVEGAASAAGRPGMGPVPPLDQILPQQRGRGADACHRQIIGAVSTLHAHIAGNSRGPARRISPVTVKCKLPAARNSSKVSTLHSPPSTTMSRSCAWKKA